MKDVITAKQRLSGLDREWITEGLKDVMLAFVVCIVFFVLVTQPNGVF